MSRLLRRFELLLPVRGNDGQAFEARRYRETAAELRDAFGALQAEGQLIRGVDRRSGEAIDTLVRYVVDCPDTAENRAFFLSANARLKERFEQDEIYITTYPVEIL